jgi:molybdate transport system substrate-binding protein
MRSLRSRCRGISLFGGLMLTLPLGNAPAFGAELIVAAAISLEAPLSEAGRRYEGLHPGTRVYFTFGASSAMAAQVRAGAPIDILVSAAERIVDSLAEDGIVDAGSRYTLVRNRLVVVVPAIEAGRTIEKPQDLLAPEVAKIAIPIAAVPLGGYAREWLRGRALLDPISRRIIPTPHARATLAAVESHHVDAAIVYATDARNARGARIAFDIPEAEQPAVAYSAVAVTRSRQPAVAADLLAFLRSDEAARLFLDRGFTLP